MICKVEFFKKKVNLHGSALSAIALCLECHSSVEIWAKIHYRKDKWWISLLVMNALEHLACLEQGDIDHDLWRNGRSSFQLNWAQSIFAPLKYFCFKKMHFVNAPTETMGRKMVSKFWWSPVCLHMLHSWHLIIVEQIQPILLIENA